MDENVKNSMITRFSNYQMKIKALSIAVLTAGTFVDITSTVKMIVLVVILLSLWALDAYYLSVERSVRAKDKENDYGKRKLREKENTWNNLFAKSVWIFHLVVTAGGVLFLLNSFLEFLK